MFNPLKYLEKAAADLRKAIDNGIVSHDADECVSELEESKQYFENELKSGKTLNPNALHWCFLQLENINCAHKRHNTAEAAKDPREESINIIRRLLDRFPITYYVKCYTKMDLPINHLIATYKLLCNHIRDCIIDIVRCENPLSVIEMRHNAISIITTTNTTFSEYIRSAVADYAHDVNVTTRNILSKVDAAMNAVTEDTSGYELSPEREKFLYELIANNSFVGGINGRRGAKSEGKDPLTGYYSDTDTSSDNATPKTAEDILALSEEARDRLKLLDEYTFSSVLHYPESKLSDPQGGRAPINPKISDKD